MGGKVEVRHQAQRVANRPFDTIGLGAYSLGAFTGILPAALAANSEIFQFRWVDSTRKCLIRRVTLSACVSTTFFSAGVPVQIDMVKATSWTVQGTGGAGVAPGATMKRDTAMGSSLVASGDIRIATTAALGAGTKNLEANSLAAIAAQGPAAAPGQIIMPGTKLWEANPSDGDYPLLLTTNEGFVIRSVAVPAAGTWTAAIQVDYAEVSTYQ